MKNILKTIKASPITIYISELFNPFYSGIGSILMFHRVVKCEEDIVFEDLEITEDHLKYILNYFIANNYDVITLDQLYDFLTGKKKIDKKFVIFTFDDGYEDNYSLAYPIFKQMNIPFTIYLSTSFPDNTSIIWWYALKELIQKNDFIEFKLGSKQYRYHLEYESEKQRVFLEVRRLILDLEHSEMCSFVSNLFHNYDIDLKAYSMKLSLSWDQIKMLAEDELVTIGAHTRNHLNLRELETNVLKKEILDSKIQIEMKINTKVEHFAYPFGSIKEVGAREADVVRALGFKTATTTRCGNIFINHRDYMQLLPRISLNPYSEGSYPKLYTNGMIPALRNRLKRIITLE